MIIINHFGLINLLYVSLGCHAILLVIIVINLLICSSVNTRTQINYCNDNEGYLRIKKYLQTKRYQKNP